MRRNHLFVAIGITWLTLVFASAAGQTPEDTTKAVVPANWKIGIDSTNIKDSTAYFIIETRHRIFGEFRQIDSVKFGQDFELGEGHEFGRVMAFSPHLGISTKGTAFTMSDTLMNPAARVRVFDKDGKMLQESWAFLFTDAPHFKRDELFGFRLLDYKVDSTFVIPPKQ